MVFFLYHVPATYTTKEVNNEYLYNSVVELDSFRPALSQYYANSPPWNFQ